MPNEFVMRGQTASGKTEVLNFSGHTPGYAYRMTEFSIYPSSGIGSTGWEIVGTVTAGKTAVAPTDPNFNDEGLIATSMYVGQNNVYTGKINSIVDDTFLITQNLILMVQDASSGGNPVNWQVKFEKIKLSSSAEAVANFNQFTIYDG